MDLTVGALVSLTVLITNIVLANRSGTEVVAEQLADGLRRRGHRPVIFAPHLGELAARMRVRGHVVIDRPDACPWPVDVIHAHHTGPAMAALAAHPGVPALFVCHDATAPFDTLPLHPRVRGFFAVDERCRARMIADGAPPSEVVLLPNAVDLSRIPPRTQPLPPRPRRAVAITKHAGHLETLRGACAAAGIALDELGSGPGTMTDWPEFSFAGADLVFATARTALEAAAAGAGVVVCDARGCAGFLSKAAAEAWLPWNLGAGILAEPTDAGTVATAIAAYSAAEAAAASTLVRESRALDPLLERLEEIYTDLVANRTDGAGASSDAAEASAIGRFITEWVPSFNLELPWRALTFSVIWPPPEMPLERIERGVSHLETALEQIERRVGDLGTALEQVERGVGHLVADSERRRWRRRVRDAMPAWAKRVVRRYLM